MPSPTTTPTETPTKAPEREHITDPERHYNPERLCPTQRQRGTKWSMP